VIMLGMLCVSITSLVSIIFNQRLLAAQDDAPMDAPHCLARTTAPRLAPFGSRPEHKAQWIAGAAVELGQVEVEFAKD
jgi:hypothetical protein